MVELNTATAAWWAEQYRGSPAAAYVAGRLGDDLSTDDRVTVGYAPSGWSRLTDHLRSHGATDAELIVDRALKLLDERHDGVPVLGDLLAIIQQAPEELRMVALDRGDMRLYHDITENLEASLLGLVGGGQLGETFPSRPRVRCAATRSSATCRRSMTVGRRVCRVCPALPPWGPRLRPFGAGHPDPVGVASATLADLHQPTPEHRHSVTTESGVDSETVATDPATRQDQHRREAASHGLQPDELERER